MNDLEVPGINNADIWQKILRGSFSSVPIAGGVVGELMALAFPTSLETRQNEWMKNVQVALNELQNKERGFTIQQLAENEEFITIFLRSTQIATRTHQKERLFLLKNSLVNFNNNIDFDFKAVFLKYVEELSISSVVVLSFLSQFQREIRAVNSFEELYNIFHDGTLVTKGKLVSVDLVNFKFLTNELETKGLIRVNRSIADLPGQVNEGGYLKDYSKDEHMPYIKVLPIGEQFLSFVYGENKPNFRK